MPIIFSIGHHKRDVFPVEIEVDISTGIFRFDIIGLGDKAVEESKLRILSALKNSGHRVSKTTEKITVLLSPANKKKEGSHFDLPIALSYLYKTGTLFLKKDIVAIGELSLSGNIKPVPDAAEYLLYALRAGFKHAIIPEGNKADILEIEDEVHENLKILYASSLNEALSQLSNMQQDEPLALAQSVIKERRKHQIQNPEQEEGRGFLIDRIIGQQHMKRALAISLSGMHHLMIWGAPGTGKSMLAKSAEELLPERNPEGFMHDRDSDFASIKKLKSGSRLVEPHHTSSYVELVGSRRNPGLIHDSHDGILLMDEWAEFDRRAIESLRQPLEEGISAGEPCSFICIATTNPCPCGYYRSGKKCACKKDSVSKYQKKIFGPVAQRFDLIIASDEVSYTHKYKDIFDESTLNGKSIRGSVNRVRMIQRNRLETVKAQLSSDQTASNEARWRRLSDTRKHARLLLVNAIRKSLDEKTLMHAEESAARLSLNQRTADALILVARTIADLDHSEHVCKKHIGEALGYVLKENPLG